MGPPMSAFSNFHSSALRTFSPLPMIGGALTLLVAVSALIGADVAQAAQNERDAQRLRENRAAVMIAAGRPTTSMMKVADDLAVVLNDPEGGFRVVPVAGDGAKGNVRDLVLLRNIDMAITDLTVLESMKESKQLSKMLPREVAHVVTLFPDKITILARKDIETLQDLSGKRVSVGMAESGSAFHAQRIFAAAGIEVQTLNMAEPDSALALTRGQIDAFVCFCLNTPEVYQRVMFEPDLHLLPIPFSGELQRDYLPTTLVHRDFPSFIDDNETIDTLAVSLVLVTYNWQKGNQRYARVEDFVNRFLNNLAALRQQPRHKGWSSVQISASAPDWPRFAAVSEWQEDNKKEAIQDMRVAFNEFLDRWTPAAAPIERNEQTKLFEEFLDWQRTSRQ